MTTTLLSKEVQALVPWLKVGDTAGTHPRVLRLGAAGDDRILNEAFGFVVRCATQSAAHMTDYVIDEGVTMLFGGGRADELVTAAVRAGLLEPIRRARGQQLHSWRIVEDVDFMHMRSAAEIEWERQRKRDGSNPALTVPVRVRDGDGCRYCGQIVQWTARRGGRRGTYDHRSPGQAATIDTYVVACFTCNATRGNDPKADERLPLLPPPAQPFYSATSLEFLARNGATPQRSGSQPDTAHATPITGHRAAAPSGADLQKSAGSSRSEVVGSGRDGSGPGPGLDGSRDGSRAPRPRGRRGKRGGR